MRGALLVLALSLLPQDEERIRGWIRDLEEDSVARRDEALSALIQAGEAAEPELRKAAQSGSTEVRARAGEALSAIAWKRLYDPTPRRVSLHADKVPLRKVLADLAARSSTPINAKDLEEAQLDAPVSVHLEQVPLSKALEAISRANGKMNYFLSCGAGQDPEVKFDSEPFADCPRVIDGTIELRLQSVGTEIAMSAKGVRTEKMQLSFAWHWEKGTRPLSGRVEIDELRDEKDASYLDRVEPEVESFRADDIPTQQERRVSRVPPEPVTRLKVIRGALVVSFPLARQEFTFDRPAGMVGETRQSRWGNVRLAEFAVGTRICRIKVETRPEELLQRLRVELLDKDGKELPSTIYSLGEMGDHGFQELEFPIEEGRIPAVVRGTAEVGRRERRVPFEFRDVRFR